MSFLSNDQIGPQIVFAMEPRTDDKFWERYLASFKHMSLWCMFLNLHLTTQHSNICEPHGWVARLGPVVLHQMEFCLMFSGWKMWAYV